MTYDPKHWLNYSDDYQSEQLPLGTINPDKELPSLCKESVNQRKEELSSLEYDPCSPALDSHESATVHGFLKERPDPRKLEVYISSLQKMIRPLSSYVCCLLLFIFIFLLVLFFYTSY